MQLRRWIPDLFWATVFGPAYVRLFGRETLLSVPAPVVTEISRDLIVVQLSESLSDMHERFEEVDRVLFLAGGGAWLTIAMLAMPLLGIDPRGDALERGNRAATLVTCSAMLGAMLCYAGANIGEGATI
jgi:hypothetical protein